MQVGLVPPDKTDWASLRSTEQMSSVGRRRRQGLVLYILWISLPQGPTGVSQFDLLGHCDTPREVSAAWFGWLSPQGSPGPSKIRALTSYTVKSAESDVRIFKAKVFADQSARNADRSLTYVEAWGFDCPSVAMLRVETYYATRPSARPFGCLVALDRQKQ